jgi:hypothetical protein
VSKGRYSSSRATQVSHSITRQQTQDIERVGLRGGSVVWKRVSIPWILVYGFDMSQLYVATSVTSLSPSKGQDGFDVFEVVKNILVLMKRGL